MTNQSTMTEFLLMGFSDERDLQIIQFVVFLFIYLVAVVGNVLIICAVTLNHCLHTPMYMFLVNLSVIDVCYISTIVPKNMAISLTNDNLISLFGCAAQVFLVLTLAGTELAILTVMAYDRYVEICQPLLYRAIMKRQACIQMVVVSWICSTIHAAIETIVTFSLHFCQTNVIGQFFCDIPHLQKISCTDTKLSRALCFSVAITIGSFCFVYILVSYGYIFTTVLKIPNEQGRHKFFSTCTPHIAVCSLFIITATYAYLRPNGLSSPTGDLLSAVFYAILPPVLNPVIYSFRNKDIQKTVWKIIKYVLYTRFR